MSLSSSLTRRLTRPLARGLAERISGGSLIPANAYQALLFGGDTFDSQGYLRDSSPGQGNYRLPRPAYAYTFATGKELRWTEADTGTQYVSYYNLGTEAWVGPTALTYDTDHYSFEPAAISITNLKRWSDNTATTEEIEATEFATAPSNLLSWHPCCEESGATSCDIYDGNHADIIGTLTGFHATNTNLAFSFADQFGYTNRYIWSDPDNSSISFPAVSMPGDFLITFTTYNLGTEGNLLSGPTSANRIYYTGGGNVTPVIGGTNIGPFNVSSDLSGVVDWEVQRVGSTITIRTNGTLDKTGTSAGTLYITTVGNHGPAYNSSFPAIPGFIWDLNINDVQVMPLNGTVEATIGADGTATALETTIIPAESATLDATGGTLQFSGRTPYQALGYANYLQGDGTGVRVDVGDVSLSPTTITAWIKQDADNQPLFTLQNSAATGVSVVADVLTFGGSLTVSEIKVDDAVVTASAAGATLNDNAWHKLELTLTAIGASNLRLHTTTSSNYGNVEIADFRLSDGTVTKTIVPEVPVGSSTPDTVWVMGSDGSATSVASAIKGTLTNVHGAAPLATEDWYMRYGGRYDSVNDKLIPAKTDGTGADSVDPDSTGGQLLPGQKIDHRGGVDSAFAQKVNLESEYTYGDDRSSVAPIDTKRKRVNDVTEDHFAAAPTAIPDSSAFTD